MVLCASLIVGCSSPSSTTAPTTPASQTLQPTQYHQLQQRRLQRSQTGIDHYSSTGVSHSHNPAPTTKSSAGTYGGTLTYIQTTAPGTPFGWPAEAAGTSMLALQISILPLLEEAYNGDLSPLLAESYDVNTSADKPSITFHLKKGRQVP